MARPEAQTSVHSQPEDRNVTPWEKARPTYASQGTGAWLRSSSHLGVQTTNHSTPTPPGGSDREPQSMQGRHQEQFLMGQQPRQDGLTRAACGSDSNMDRDNGKPLHKTTAEDNKEAHCQRQGRSHAGRPEAESQGPCSELRAGDRLSVRRHPRLCGPSPLSCPFHHS